MDGRAVVPKVIVGVAVGLSLTEGITEYDGDIVGWKDTDGAGVGEVVGG